MICDQCETVSHCSKQGCIPLQTNTDSGHKVAHGRRTDYYGKAAEGNPDLPIGIDDGGFFDTVDEWLIALRWPLLVFSICALGGFFAGLFHLF